jgi:hypothetical protein
MIIFMIIKDFYCLNLHLIITGWMKGYEYCVILNGEDVEISNIYGIIKEMVNI